MVVVGYESQTDYKRVACSQARASCAPPSWGAVRPATSGASSPGTGADREPSPQHGRAGKEGGPSSPSGTLTLPWPSACPFLSPAGVRWGLWGHGPGARRQGRGWRARGRQAPSQAPSACKRRSEGRCPRDLARAGRSGHSRRDSWREGARRREGDKDLALSFSAVSLVGRGGTYDLALDQISSWSGQTSVQNTLTGRADQMGLLSKMSFPFYFKK